MAGRELASLRREKTIVLALLIQLFIAAFSSFLLVGLVSLYDPGAVAGTGIAIGVAGNASGTVTGAVADDGPWRLVEYDDGGDAEAAFRAGRVDALLLAEETRAGRIAVEALVPDESVRSTVVVVELRAALEALERERRQALAHRLERPPVPVPDVPASPPTFAFTYTVLLPLLVFLPVFISGSVAADAITEELDAGTLELLRVTPLSAVEIVEGKMLAMAALAPAQAALWLGLLWLNGTRVARPLAILALVAATATVVVVLGTGLALGLRDRQSTQLVYSLGVIVLFVAASALPETPANAVARLAVGSHGPATLAMVAEYVVIGVAAVPVLRRWVAREVA
ncbi:MAG: ABC transporter permease [Halobacteriales archaeon]